MNVFFVKLRSHNLAIVADTTDVTNSFSFSTRLTALLNLQKCFVLRFFMFMSLKVPDPAAEETLALWLYYASSSDVQ